MKIKPRKLKLGELADKLESMTAQEVLNACYGHMVAQGNRSFSDACDYNGVNGDCCVAGPFIKDYNERMEGKPWAALVDDFSQSSAHELLILELQAIHDSKKKLE